MALEKFGPHKYQRVHRAFQAKVAECFFVVQVGELCRPILFAPYDNDYSIEELYTNETKNRCYNTYMKHIPRITIEPDEPASKKLKTNK
jgi:hypothetical protein